MSICEADSMSDSDRSPLMVHFFHEYVQYWRTRHQYELLSLIWYYPNNNIKIFFFWSICVCILHIYKLIADAALWRTSLRQKFEMNPPSWFTIYLSPDLLTQTSKCGSRQTQSEMWIHQNFTGKDRSSRMGSSIKILFPLISDHTYIRFK